MEGGTPVVTKYHSSSILEKDLKSFCSVGKITCCGFGKFVVEEENASPGIDIHSCSLLSAYEINSITLYS